MWSTTNDPGSGQLMVKSMGVPQIAQTELVARQRARCRSCWDEFRRTMSVFASVVPFAHVFAGCEACPVLPIFGIIPVGGVRSDLFAPGSDPQQVDDQLRRTLVARENKPFLLAPSCTIPTPADPELLRLLRNAR